jgi:hypothetical protein
LKRINEEEGVPMLPMEPERPSGPFLHLPWLCHREKLLRGDTGENLRQNAHVRQFYMELGTVDETNSYREALQEKKEGVRLG